MFSIKNEAAKPYMPMMAVSISPYTIMDKYLPNTISLTFTGEDNNNLMEPL